MKIKTLLTAIPILCSFPAIAQTYSSSGSVTTAGSSFCDVTGPGINSTINVSATGLIAHPDDVTIGMQLTSPGEYAPFAKIVLFAPDGDSCILINFVGRLADCSFMDVTFSGANTLSFNAAYTTALPSSLSPGASVSSGNYKPTGGTYASAVGNLTTFLTGKSVNGNWSLRAYSDFFTVTLNAWSISFGATALPLDLLSFSAKQTAAGKVFNWKTGSERNTKDFELERSTNGTQFSTAGVIPAAGTGTNTYSFTDDFYTADILLYRLKIVDLDGSAKYSNTIQFTGGASAYQPVTISPNPGKEQISIHLGTNNDLVHTTAVIADMMGRPVQTIAITGDNQSVDIAAIPAGTYMIRLANGDVKSFCKIN